MDERLPVATIRFKIYSTEKFPLVIKRGPI
jgi:hypothetical protein